MYSPTCLTWYRKGKYTRFKLCELAAVLYTFSVEMLRVFGIAATAKSVSTCVFPFLCTT